MDSSTNSARKSVFASTKGFTLIELLIVVAIIAILAAIAVPNFLEAQVRSKVSRVKNDLRTMRTAVESYAVDNNRYPRTSWGCAPFLDTINGQLVWGTVVPGQITSPISYLTSLPHDPFSKGNTAQVDAILYTYQDTGSLQHYRDIGSSCPVPGNAGYVYVPGSQAQLDNMEFFFGKYFLWSIGPAGNNQDFPNNFFQTYDPTNGTVSYGRIFVTQKRTDAYYVPINAFP